ncbi:hypothetical protein Pint_05084 [Pistacia integerrima]|uniref:Uncharacterized protein n=1 Tax=Pistacia integerrima TaxID=434235 RepID=A0ACC0Z2P7_9ROSI|nr:hypothetical protein Pint_05084 [Pistacia integerrima]
MLFGAEDKVESRKFKQFEQSGNFEASKQRSRSASLPTEKTGRKLKGFFLCVCVFSIFIFFKLRFFFGVSCSFFINFCVFQFLILFFFN